MLDIKKLAPPSSGRLQLLAPQLSGHILKFVSRLFGTLHKLAPDFQVNPLTLSSLSLSGTLLRLYMLSTNISHEKSMWYYRWYTALWWLKLSENLSRSHYLFSINCVIYQFSVGLKRFYSIFRFNFTILNVQQYYFLQIHFKRLCVWECQFKNKISFFEQCSLINRHCNVYSQCKVHTPRKYLK